MNINQDLIYIAWWWLVFFAFGVASIPLCWFFFRKFIDLGYGFAKIIGLLIVAFIAFLGAIFHLLPLTNPNLLLISAGYFFINIHLFLKNKQKIVVSVRKSLKILLAQEMLFTIGLVFWSYVRAHQPDIGGLEKFMDFGFINSILRSQYLPPVDMWFAGEPINYYWFGHFWVAVITKITKLASAITYNLMLATILGLTLTATFSLVATLFKKLSEKIDIRLAFVAGLLSAILLVFGGNFHAPVYILKEGAQSYWYPDATRFIGYHPETNDKTIHEFPIYSFVVSDLHAHLINLPFVLLFIALLWIYVENSKNKKRTLVKYLIPPGFVLGIMFMTNTWDFGNYLLVTGIVLVVTNLKTARFFEALKNTAKSVAAILAIGIFTFLPFLLTFTPIAQGVRFVHSRSPLWQLVILWGLPAILTLIFIVLLSKEKKKIKTPDNFIISLLLASWILILLPEIIFVKDIYIASHYRANTVFKLTYQAFVLSYLSSGYIAVRTVTLIKEILLRRLVSLFFLVIFFAILVYPSFAINSYYGELKTYRGLNGETWLKVRYPAEYEAIGWLRQNVDGQPVILEAPGDSYTDFNVVSAYTGLPTVSGWFVHEWLWRGSADFPQKRVIDIAEIYRSPDVTRTKLLLNKYNVGYLIVGTFEREKYPDLNEEKFTTLGTQVFSSGNTKIYQIIKN